MFAKPAKSLSRVCLRKEIHGRHFHHVEGDADESLLFQLLGELRHEGAFPISARSVDDDVGLSAQESGLQIRQYLKTVRKLVSSCKLKIVKRVSHVQQRRRTYMPCHGGDYIGGS